MESVDPEDRTRTVDVLEYPSEADETYRLVQSGKGEQIVQAHIAEHRKQEIKRWVFGIVLAVGAVGYGVATENLVLGGLGAAVVLGAFWIGSRNSDEFIPRVVDRNMYPRNAADRYDLGEGALETE